MRKICFKIDRVKLIFWNKRIIRRMNKNKITIIIMMSSNNNKTLTEINIILKQGNKM